MLKVFAAQKTEYPNSAALVQRILSKEYGETNFCLLKTANGKPYLTGIANENARNVSISHTNEWYFVAFSSEEIGIDAEPLDRTVDFSKITRKFTENERSQIRSTEDFLRFWTMRESVVKHLGITIIESFKRLSFDCGTTILDGAPFPVSLLRSTWQGHSVCVCKSTAEEVSIVRIV
ncbi:MAG: 4'-phosphopantetheinyl transferase superfamily protein [Clostridia bacterium]|nr:4'-phosphopantetheinyl transferase superfamily protein [Clostridia bacterium]